MDVIFLHNGHQRVWAAHVVVFRVTYNKNTHHHHVHEGLGVFPVP
jgi:hypothetical protein